MNGRLLHVFRNNPLGRETLLQSIYFCKTLNLSLYILIPSSTRFFMSFENDTISVDLDKSYLAFPETSLNHSMSIAEQHKIRPEWITLQNNGKAQNPNISTSFDYMYCPRSMREESSKIRLGYIDTKIRQIICRAPFPVLIGGPVFKPWRSIAVFWEGLNGAKDVLDLGLQLSRDAHLPLDIFSPQGKEPDLGISDTPDDRGNGNILEKRPIRWHQYTKENLTEYLYKVPHDALVCVKNTSKPLVKNYSSTMEIIQSTVPNNLLIAG